MNGTLAATTTHTIPFRGRTTALTLVLPGAIIAATLATAWAWRGSMPDPIAVHWGTNGPDGFGSFAPNILWPEAVAAITAVLLWALGYFAGSQSAIRKSAAGIAVWMAVLMSGVNFSIMSLQRGLTDAHAAGSINGPMAFVFLAATAAAIGAAVLSPSDPPLPATEPVAPTAARLALRPGEHATWIREVTSRGYVGAVVAVVAGEAIIGLLSRAWGLALVLGLVIGLSLVVFLHWTVIVNDEGLTVRSALSWPRFVIPLDEVEMAEVVQVRPLPEFGGWGVRGGKGGRVGVIIRKGPALQVHRSGGRVFLVTVDDAETGAALLNTLAARARG
ncbi:MAG TPA: DUF1648 domain-containing protein [Demequinaceae bacterium]